LLQKFGFQTVAGMEIGMFSEVLGINTKLDYKVKKFNAEADSKQNQMKFLWLRWIKIT
jgi:hypothetical protein